MVVYFDFQKLQYLSGNVDPLLLLWVFKFVDFLWWMWFLRKLLKVFIEIRSSYFYYFIFRQENWLILFSKGIHSRLFEVSNETLLFFRVYFSGGECYELSANKTFCEKYKYDFNYFYSMFANIKSADGPSITITNPWNIARSFSQRSCKYTFKTQTKL